MPVLINNISSRRYRQPEPSLSPDGKPVPAYAPKRIYPIDDYEPKFGLVTQYATEHHFLWMPLLGQCYEGLNPKMPSWLCGKTSQSMIYNFFQLAKGGDPKERYITHWTGDRPGWRLDPRFPNGDRAFCLGPVADRDPEAQGRDGGTTGIEVVPAPVGGGRVMPADYTKLARKDRLIQNLCHYDGDHLHPFGALKGSDANGMKARAQSAAEIADNPAKLEAALQRVLNSLRKNNPVLLYGSVTSGEIHVMTIAGYCRLREAGKEPSLWLLIADPAQPPLRDSDRGPSLKGTDPVGLPRRESKHEVITLVRGDWSTAQASLYLLKASTLFREKPGHQSSFEPLESPA